MTTECDLTNSLDKIKDTYSAVVVSEPLPGMSSDLPELPYTKAERFCPYKDSTIGKPDFTIDVSKDKRKITLNITDPTSAIYADNKFLTMRDIFMSDLKYKVTYGKAQTSGKRFKDTETSQIVLDVDKGASYCFTVQAYIISRDPGKQLGESSQVKCSPAGDRPFYEGMVE
ncbi:hypothetical protein JZ751_024977 [Albula glossodonta]|uniref:Tissue factor n=1 Tax=Albula glossodonta TaxID=121402 RepID=A0A8T2PMP9_9TELE|nr:hypothetical protein JZ751_024977 [Albula glossodonta]